eukprot:496371_1
MSFFSKQAFAEDEDDSDSDIDCEFGNAIFSQTNHTIKPIQIIKNEVTTTTTNKPIVHHQILGNISDIQSLDLDTEDDIIPLFIMVVLYVVIWLVLMLHVIYAVSQGISSR